MADFSMKSLPEGFRFKPKDTELINYLRRKINGNGKEVNFIREIDICKSEPWELPDFSVLETDDMEWFFFCPINWRYQTGRRRERATAKGFWKPTGKDRKIKKGTCVIGMKKSLVFYEKSVPKPKKTDWKIHEYSTTLPELDGTHPGQGAYVLCRLFKDDDKKGKGSQGDDEVEHDVSSPTTPKCSPEDKQLELAQGTPVLGVPAEQLTNYESCQDENFDRMTPNTQVPDDCHSNSYKCNNTDDRVAEGTATEVDPRLEEDMDLLYVLLQDPEDCGFLSTLDFQMPTEQGSCYMHSPVSQNVVSVVEDSRSSSELDPEAARAQLQALAGKDCLQMGTTDEDRQTRSHTNAVRNGDGIGNGIRIRTRPPENRPGTQSTFNQGTATRRIGLQSRLEVRPLFSHFRAEYHEGKSTFTEEGKAAEKHTNGATYVTAFMRESKQEVTVNLRPKLRSKSNVPNCRDENIPSALSKTSLAHCTDFSSVSMPSVVVAVVVFIMFVGIWRCLKSYGCLESNFSVYNWP